ncbi:porin [Pedobacter africanus]|uniref:Phosphate-selective porin O and P n=1 Tax=Pedobacter africanus TaxID=151894 RepID=A0A1W1ZN93_9SPHI|nr:porin [Pedobacter africanus]SMC50030.1 Phosphate-selective porin O and P [Pedobacter africanus]
MELSYFKQTCFYLLLFSPVMINAQGINVNLSEKSKINFSGMLQTQFNYSLDKDVDIAGKHHTGTEYFSRNSFSVKRARLQLNATISDRINAVILVNFGDFTGNPQNKVLENAFIKYSINDYVNFQFGQFRPQFGQEDNYPVDFVRSIDYSNGYYLFGANSWQSFQIGASYFGAIKDLPIAIKYYIGVYNGNNRNQTGDNDDGKIVPARLVFGLGKSTELGISAGAGKNMGQKIWAWGADIDYKRQLDERWNIEMVSEYKQGVNSVAYFDQADPLVPVSHFGMRGIYLQPNAGYSFKHTRLKSLEFAFRYEYLDADFKQQGNARQSYIPMVSASFAEAYAIRVQLGLLMDRYQNNIPNTTQYNTNRLICQVQARF